MGRTTSPQCLLGAHVLLIDANSGCPTHPITQLLRVNVDMKWKGVVLRRCDGWYVILMRVNQSNDFHGGILQRRLGCFANLSTLFAQSVSEFDDAQNKRSSANTNRFQSGALLP